jgi:Uri superfamily endonuclease
VNIDIPRTHGSYCLLLFLQRKTTVIVGKLGDIDFKKGYYLYMGSAFGPGGLQARLQRHMADTKSLRWHIDYLRTEAVIRAIWMERGGQNMEHQWARYLLAQGALCFPVEHFGSSDCRCRSHLFYFKKRPCFETILPTSNLVEMKITKKN